MYGKTRCAKPSIMVIWERNWEGKFISQKKLVIQFCTRKSVILTSEVSQFFSATYVELQSVDVREEVAILGADDRPEYKPSRCYDSQLT